MQFHLMVPFWSSPLSEGNIRDECVATQFSVATSLMSVEAGLRP